MPQVRTILASLTLLLAAASASATNLVANGDFEAATPDVSSWTTSADIFTQRVDPDTSASATPHAGLVYTDASYASLGLLSQSLATQNGARYALEFDLYLLVSDGSPADNQAKVWFGNTVVLDLANQSQDWTHYSFSNLTASSASTLLQFGLRSGNADYPALDNISVIMTAVPEPSAALMLAAGLILIVRRRSKRPPPF